MKNEKTFILNPNNTKRIIDFVELNQLKKDILWIYDENIGQINVPFAPSYSFKLKYWEYLTLDGNEWFFEEERTFYYNGILVILLCFCVEYNCIESGDQQVFKRSEIPIILKYVKNYVPKNEYERRIREKILIGLDIAGSMTNEQLLNSDFKHNNSAKFYDNVNAIGNHFIIKYYKSKLKKV